MELFWSLVLLLIAGAASLVDVVRQSRANPDQKIPWLGNPPRLPRWWFAPRVVMIFAITGGINLLWRAAGVPRGSLASSRLSPSLYLRFG